MTLVSLTNGDAGHHEMRGPALAARRLAEAKAAGACLGAEYLVLDNHDGLLEPSLEVRLQVVRVMRELRPHLVMCHRPYDYHPDHRYTGQVVQDAALLTFVGAVLPEVPPLAQMPVVVYTYDEFQKPYPFQPDILVDVDAVSEKKLGAACCHVSQFFEAGAQHHGQRVPNEPALRCAWLREQLEPVFTEPARKYREKLVEVYGKERGSRIHYAEAFEVCEYGAPLPPGEYGRLFPFR